MKKRILLVDDDISLLNSISCYLISQNFLVFIVDNVNAALSEIVIQKPDLIISDIMMPNTDGYNFIDILRSNNALYDIPIIFLTAKGMTNDRIKGYDVGCNAYLTKPFDPNELVSIINNLLKNKALSQKNITVKKHDILLTLPKHIDNLTNREKAILELVIKGFRNKEIAQLLHVSIRSVEKYVSKLLNKTSTRNRTELAQFINSNNVDFFKGE